MSFKNKLLSACTLISVLLSASGCSDDTWIAKDNSQTMPVGVYIYDLFTSYNDAYKEIMAARNYDYNSRPENILEETIDGRNSIDWIKEKAITKCKNIFALDYKLNELSITLTDEEKTKAESLTLASWNAYKKSFQNYGISRESYHLASSLYDVKYKRLEDQIFGDNGTEKITDEQIENYFTERYTSYCYISVPLISTDNDNKTSVLPDEKISELEKMFDDYANSINNKTLTYTAVVDLYKKAESITEDPSTENITDLKEDTRVPSVITAELKKLENGKASKVKSSDMSTLYLVYKKDIKGEVNTEKYVTLKDNVSDALKKIFMDSMLENLAASLNIQINESAIKKYNPAIFVQSY